MNTWRSRDIYVRHTFRNACIKSRVLLDNHPPVNTVVVMGTAPKGECQMQRRGRPRYVSLDAAPSTAFVGMLTRPLEGEGHHAELSSKWLKFGFLTTTPSEIHYTSVVGSVTAYSLNKCTISQLILCNEPLYT